jgi:hypothetical protein
MGDDSSRSIVKSLKNEWSLFLEAFQGEDELIQNPPDQGLANGKLEVLSLDQIRELAKALSADRKKLNQKMESLSKEIDLNSAKLESIRLVGGEDESVLKRINELNDAGESVAKALEILDKQLRAVRRQEDFLQEELLTT